MASDGADVVLVKYFLTLFEIISDKVLILFFSHRLKKNVVMTLNRHHHHHHHHQCLYRRKRYLMNSNRMLFVVCEHCTDIRGGGGAGVNGPKLLSQLMTRLSPIPFLLTYNSLYLVKIC